MIRHHWLAFGASLLASGCCCRSTGSTWTAPPPPRTRAPAAETPVPPTAEKASAPAEEAVQVLSVVGNWAPGYRGFELLQKAGIVCMGDGGVGFSLLVRPLDAKAAREILSRDSVCAPYVWVHDPAAESPASAPSTGR